MDKQFNFIKIICFGDSLTNGARDEYYRNYPMELADLLNKKRENYYHCLNFGINGETTSHMLNRAYSVLYPNRDARMVLFMGGTNDSKVPIPLDIYRGNVENIIILCNALSLEIAVGILPPIYGTGLPCYSQEQGNDYIRKYNAILLEIIQKYNLRHCDFSAYNKKYFCDGIHMNHEGYKKMAHDWFNVLESFL